MLRLQATLSYESGLIEKKSSKKSLYSICAELSLTPINIATWHDACCLAILSKIEIIGAIPVPWLTMSKCVASVGSFKILPISPILQVILLLRA